MHNKLINRPFTKRSVLVFSMIFAFIISGGLQEAMAQKSGTFRSNGRDVNIKQFNKEMSKMLEATGIPGMSVAIIDNNEVVFANGYGRRRQGKAMDAADVKNFYEGYSVKKLKTSKKVDRATVFNGASLSKSTLAFVAYQLVDEGKLDLDKPMYEYFDNDRLKHDERYKQITTRMVLSHSSGLENWQFQNNGDTLEILTPPGEAFVYSGEGYYWLALAMEKIIDEGYTAYTTKRVIEGLGLKNTYMKFNELGDKEWLPLRKSVPSNFAPGHPFAGGQYLLRNTYPNPAYAHHFSAEDYAKLITAMFNPEHVSYERRKDIMEAQVEIVENSANYYGPGFEITYTKSDTIISHGGDNPGIKNMMYYSPVNKRGFVVLTNNEWGKAAVSRINELTANLDLEQYTSPKRGIPFAVQYPSPGVSLLKTWSQEGTEAMLKQFETLKNDPKMDAFAINGAAWYFLVYGPDENALPILEYAQTKYPDDALTQAHLGRYYMQNDQPQVALKHFEKSKELKFSLWALDGFVERCKKAISAED